MPLRYRPRLNLTEREIRDAMKHTRSNFEAARYLGISYNSYKKYAKLYIDEDSGKTLLDLHKNASGKGIKRNSSASSKYSGIEGLMDILAGKYPIYSGRGLKKRLIKEAILPECCDMCQFEEKRITDDTVPLILVYKDGDKSNHRLENLQLVCYNCYYLCIGSMFGSTSGDDTKFKGY